LTLTYDIPDLLTSHRIKKNSQKTEEKKRSQEKKREETLRRATEEDPSPGWTEAREVM